MMDGAIAVWLVPRSYARRPDRRNHWQLEFPLDFDSVTLVDSGLLLSLAAPFSVCPMISQ